MTIDTTTYYVLNLAPLLSALPATGLTWTRTAQDWLGHTTTGRPEIRETALAVQRLTRWLWLVIAVWCVVLDVQTLSQLFLPPVQPHLLNNLWRAVGWFAAGGLTLAVAVLDTWHRSDLIRAIYNSAIREVDPIVRPSSS